MAALIFMMGACAQTGTSPRDMDSSTFVPVVISASPYEQDVKGGTAKNGAQDRSSLVTLAFGDHLRERRLAIGEQLPSTIDVPVTNFSLVPIKPALQAILAPSGITVTSSEPLDDHVVSVENLKGSLPQVVDQICNEAAVFCTYHQGILELQTRESFCVDLPQESKNTSVLLALGEGIKNRLNSLPIGDVHVDPLSASIVYTTDVIGQKRVRDYLEQLRHGFPLVSVQTYVWVIALDDKNKSGLNWTALNMPHNDNVHLANGSGIEPPPHYDDNTNINVISLDQFNMTSLSGFLSQQGHLQALDNFQLAYVADQKVHPSPFLFSGTDGFEQRKDFEIEMGGIYDKDLLTINLKWHSKSDGALNKNDINVRARFHLGENMVLSRLLVPPPSSTLNNLSLLARPEEVVIALNPSLYFFSDQAIIARPRAQTSDSLLENWPEPILIDKDGVQSLGGPSLVDATPPTPSALSNNASLPDSVIANKTNASVLETVPLSPEEQEAVDIKLREHSLAHTLDDAAGVHAPQPISKSGNGI